jgi:hypothetical protein
VEIDIDDLVESAKEASARRKRTRRNPPPQTVKHGGKGVNPVDAATIFIQQMVSMGVEFTEEEIVEAGLDLGVPEESVLEWLEEVASWLGG